MITGQPERGFIERSRAGSQVVLAYVLQRKLPGQGNKKAGDGSPLEVALSVSWLVAGVPGEILGTTEGHWCP